MLKSTLFIVFIIMSSAGFVHAVATTPAVPTESHFQTVEKLLTISSAAKRIDESDNTDAKKKQAKAIELFEQAKTAAADSNGERAATLLGEATKMMFTATRMIQKSDDSINKELRDFDMRLVSIDALCLAYRNISEEKGLGDSKQSELYPFVQERLSVAKKLKQQSRFKEGRKVLDEAYVAAKVAIEHLRGGETLVHSLNFKTHEDEYHYEIDRNDTHGMLVKILLEEKIKASDQVRKKIDEYMAKAKVLRLKAEKQADDGEYEMAISILEQSTKEIVRAIRSAGIYIPG